MCFFLFSSYYLGKFINSTLFQKSTADLTKLLIGIATYGLLTSIFVHFPINYTFEDNKSSYSIKYKSKKEIILLDDGADESMALSIKSKNEIHDPLYMLIKIMTNYPNINNKFETISKGRLKIYIYSLIF